MRAGALAPSALLSRCQLMDVAANKTDLDSERERQFELLPVGSVFSTGDPVSWFPEAGSAW